MKDQSTIRIILGAGVAGVNAAITFAKQGVKSVLIDENVNIGGAMYRHTNREIQEYPLPKDMFYQRRMAFEKAFSQYRDYIHIMPRTQVLGALEGQKKISIYQNKYLQEIEGDHFLVCTGCYDRAQPFPGWALPGVMALGGLQLQVKAGYVKPGNDVTLVGTGPLLLLAATQLHSVGINIKAVIEAGRFVDYIKYAPALLHNIPMLAQGFKYQRYLKKHGIPLRYGWGIVEARGKEQVEEVVVAPYDRNWRPNLKKSEVITTDCLGVSYGFVCRTQLTEMMGCEHIHERNRGGFQPIKDSWMRTTKQGIYTAGDCAGFDGAEVATLEGQIAALASMMDTNTISKAQANKLAAPLNKKLKRTMKFRTALAQFSELRPGLLDLPNDDTIICRCEGVRLGTLKEELRKGIHTERSLKMSTRLAMGDCQGKICTSFSSEITGKIGGFPLTNVGDNRPRFPLAPIPFASFLQKKEETSK